MSVLILSCPCGLQMKARGATPGRVGRCPKCGRTLKVPDAPAARPAEVGVEAGVGADEGPAARGYGVHPSSRPPSTPAPIAAQFGHSPDRGPGREEKGGRRAVAASTLPPVARPVEPWWRPDVRFPARGAEGLMMVGCLGLAFWFLTVLIPELCLQFVADASNIGASMMGYLVALIAGLPSLIFTPAAIVYGMQYHGRVLVSGAMGEVVPPRPPDRNFDGLTNGIGPWVVWLTCGASIGFGPLACYLASRGWDSPASPRVALVLMAAGLPYALMSLMMAFLHEQGIPRPFGVVGALMRFNFGFLGISAFVGGLGVIVWMAFAGLLMLREGHYWTYLPAMLAAECLAQWALIVAMRVVGVFYFHHASILRWHREKPWWGTTWGT